MTPKCSCGGTPIETVNTIEKWQGVCGQCGTTVVKLYGLPRQIHNACHILEGKELCDKVIEILVEFDLVTPKEKVAL